VAGCADAWLAVTAERSIPLAARAAGAAVATFAGGFSPGATSHAIVSPTGITAPTSAVTPARTPSPGGFDLDHRLIGFDFEERLALGDALAFFFSPGQEFAGFLRHFERGHYDADRHSVNQWLRRSSSV
jgi:hypothetical protein